MLLRRAFQLIYAPIDGEQLREAKTVRTPRSLEVSMQWCVTETGRVSHIEVIDDGGAPEVAADLVEQMGKWRFKPAIVDGQLSFACTRTRFEVELTKPRPKLDRTVLIDSFYLTAFGLEIPTSASCGPQAPPGCQVVPNLSLTPTPSDGKRLRRAKTARTPESVFITIQWCAFSPDAKTISHLEVIDDGGAPKLAAELVEQMRSWQGTSATVDGQWVPACTQTVVRVMFTRVPSN
jgi:hypothetical protein